MLLDLAMIERALRRLDEELGARGVRAEAFLVGGVVMCLVHHARPSTRDVDGWFTEAPVVRAAVRAVAEELGLPADWLNDAAKGFIPPNAGYERWREFANLSVSTVDTETLLAMKCAAGRTDVDGGDIRTLAGILGLTSSTQILDIVTRYFPEERLPIRIRLLLEEMFDDGA